MQNLFFKQVLNYLFAPWLRLGLSVNSTVCFVGMEAGSFMKFVPIRAIRVKHFVSDSLEGKRFVYLYLS